MDLKTGIRKNQALVWNFLNTNILRKLTGSFFEEESTSRVSECIMSHDKTSYVLTKGGD